MIPSAATLPWLVPGLVVTLVFSVLASGAVGRWLRVRRSVGWVLLVSLGLILSATLSPLEPQITGAAGSARTCDLSRTWVASFSDLLYGEDVALNIFMFVPIGCALGIAPLSRRKVLVIVGAIALPFAIETVQLFVLPLGRGCQGADVVDNLTGLVIGLVAGIVLARLAPVVGRPIESGS